MHFVEKDKFTFSPAIR